MLKKVSYFIVAIALFLGFKFNVNANTVDYDRDGSIEIVLHELEEDTYVEGAEIRLYRVADIVKNRVKLTFEYTEEFSSCEVSLDNLEREELSKDIAKCVKEDSTSLVDYTDDDGYVKFDELPLGLYLIKQTNKVDGYSVIEPFLVHTPATRDNRWVYDIEATPKTEITRLMDVIVEKVWDVEEGIVLPESIIIELLKDGEVIDEVTLTEEDKWTHTWVQIDESDEYSVREKVVPHGYAVTYRQEGNKFIVTNIRALGGTGQEHIIWLLLGSLGFILVIFGVIYDRKNKYE